MRPSGFPTAIEQQRLHFRCGSAYVPHLITRRSLHRAKQTPKFCLIKNPPGSSSSLIQVNTHCLSVSVSHPPCSRCECQLSVGKHMLRVFPSRQLHLRCETCSGSTSPRSRLYVHSATGLCPPCRGQRDLSIFTVPRDTSRAKGRKTNFLSKTRR